jgi:hypothetical protein
MDEYQVELHASAHGPNAQADVTVWLCVMPNIANIYIKIPAP